MRILVGIVEIAGQISIFADGFRRLGHQVTTAIGEKNPLYPDVRYDVDVCPQLVNWSWKVNRAAQLALLPRLIASHDVFAFQWAGSSLMSDHRDLPLLKKFGKRVVSFFCGDDVRHATAYAQQFSDVAPSSDHSERLRTDPLERPLRNIRMAERYSDLIVSAPNLAGLALRPYLHFLVPVNLDECRAKIPGRDVPVIVHAPSDKGVKGTHLILPALERLRSEGVRFELRLLHGVPHRQVLAELFEADAAIDQLHLPIHGKFGVEAMASGCALACGNREDYEPFPPNRPVWHIDPEGLHAQLRELLTDKELRVRLAHEGRRYAERYHDHVAVARRIVERLDAPARADGYDHYPTFFARRYQLPEGVEIPPDLKRLTAQIVRRWGLPEGAEPQDMVSRRLMSGEGWNSSEPIPRWKPHSQPAETITT